VGLDGTRHYIALLLRAIGGALLQIGTVMFYYYSLLSYRSPAAQGDIVGREYIKLSGVTCVAPCT
jgi:hypothetical protein